MKYEDLVMKSKKIIEDIKIEINNLMIEIPYKLEYRIKSEDHIYRKLQKNNLKNIIDEKGISRSRLATMVAMNYDLVNRYYNNKVTRVDLDVIARFCYVLNCELDEILTYKKEY